MGIDSIMILVVRLFSLVPFVVAIWNSSHYLGFNRALSGSILPRPVRTMPELAAS